MVSVSQAPIFRWVVAPRPDQAAVEALSERLHLPGALAALLVQRGQGNADVARKYLRPALDDLSDPMALAGMAEAVIPQSQVTTSEAPAARAAASPAGPKS